VAGHDRASCGYASCGYAEPSTEPAVPIGVHGILSFRREDGIARLQDEIEACQAPAAGAGALLQTIPGVGAVTAAAIGAEIGPDVSRFPQPEP
jgi:hypothetical protein